MKILKLKLNFEDLYTNFVIDSLIAKSRIILRKQRIRDAIETSKD